MSTPPSGNVTFLFTDIEGSAALWEQQPEAMQAALADHDAVWRKVVEAHGGFIFKSAGDNFCIAFETATGAVAAAVAARQGLQRLVSLPVRMALHTGEADERGGDYFGPTLNRVARLLSAGHGGQTLLSLATYELARDYLPRDIRLRDLGEHRLKDLTRPERIYQLVAPDLPNEFPPLRSLESRRNNLPAQPTALIGREKEVEAVRDLLMRSTTRLLTLTGPGGTGKTRLSLQVAADLIDQFENGVFFVALAPITDPKLVASTIAQALDVQEQGSKPLVETLKENLRDKRMLLVLDNFEQITAAGPTLTELLAAAPRLKILVSSRAVLRVYGEREWAVPPLGLPDAHARLTPEQLQQYEAVRLFVERAREVNPHFELTEDNAADVAAICYRLDGLPLAIELAAARARALAPQTILQRLTSRLQLLTSGAADRPTRQRTLRGAIEWSHDLLDPGLKDLFRRLAVFTGGCTLEAAEAVCNPDGDLDVDVLDGVEALVGQSLVRQAPGPDNESRFVMLETIREYALEQLQDEDRGEGSTLREQHAAYFLELVEEAEPKLYGRQQVSWLNRLEAEHDNIRAALEWGLDCQDGVELVLRLSGAARVFWERRGHLSEGRRWLEAALETSGASRPSKPRVKALFGAGLLAYRQGDFGRAAALNQASLTEARALQDKSGEANALHALGLIAWAQGDYAAAEPLFQDSLALFRELRDRFNAAWALHNLGMLQLFQGHWSTAEPFFEEALVLSRQLDDARGIAQRLIFLGYAVLLQGNTQRGASLISEALTRQQQVGDKWFIIYGLIGAAGVAGAQGQAARGARLLGAADALAEMIRAPLLPAFRYTYSQLIAPIQAALDETTFATARAAGRALTPEAAVALALAHEPDA